MGPSTNIEKLWLLCVSIQKEMEPKRKKIVSIDFLGSKVYSKLKCSNKLVPIADSILLQNWDKRLSYKSIKVKKWLVTYDLENENHEESETVCPLPRFKRVQKVYFKDGYLFFAATIVKDMVLIVRIYFMY